MVLKTIMWVKVVLVFEGQESRNYSNEVIRLESLILDGSHDGHAEGWTGYPAATQGQYSLKQSQGELSGLSPLRSDGSSDSQTVGWTSCLVAKDAQMRVRKQL
jgi:hypothetical protein